MVGILFWSSGGSEEYAFIVIIPNSTLNRQNPIMGQKDLLENYLYQTGIFETIKLREKYLY